MDQSMLLACFLVPLDSLWLLGFQRDSNWNRRGGRQNIATTHSIERRVEIWQKYQFLARKTPTLDTSILALDQLTPNGLVVQNNEIKQSRLIMKVSFTNVFVTRLPVFFHVYVEHGRGSSCLHHDSKILSSNLATI